MKFSARAIALLQAAGLTAYVAVFAFLALHIQPWLIANRNVHPILGIILFLLTFVFSALVSGALILGYPVFLFFEGRRSEALRIVVWSALFLLFFLCVVLLVAILFQR